MREVLLKRLSVGGAYCSKPISIAFILCMLGSSSMADSLQDQIDKIVLVDESNSTLEKQSIIGCDDTLEPVEKENCYKESASAILNQLSSKSSFDGAKSSRDSDIEEIKKQLNAILLQLALLQKQQVSTPKNNKKIIKNSTTTEVQKSVTIEKRQEIKVVEETADYTKIEVQRGENLSFYAKKYYGDSRKYHVIYSANQDKIGKDLQIFEGVILKIPTVGFLERDVSQKSSGNEVLEEIKVEKKSDIEISKILEKSSEVIKEIKVETKSDIHGSSKVLDKKDVLQENDSANSSSEVEVLEEVVIEADDESVSTIGEKNSSTEKQGLSWVETKVRVGDDIYKIAQRYYGDSKEYYNIYNANRDVIREDLKLKVGMSIKIPITKLFEEKPEFLNIQ